MNTSKRLIVPDIFKLIMAFLVVGIHFDTYISEDVFISFSRIAVLFFFIISGYFAACKDSELTQRAKRTFISSLKYLLIAILVYFAYDLIFALANGEPLTPILNKFIYKDGFFVNFFIYSLPNTSGYHLWFLVALFITSIMHFILCKLKLTKAYYFIIPTALVLNLMFGEYSNALGIGTFPTYVTRNALLTGLPFFGIGFLFRKNAIKVDRNKSYYFLVIGIILACLQVLEMFTVDPTDISDGRIYVSTIMSILSLFIFSISIDIRSEKFYKYIDKNLAFNIYLFHVIVGRVVKIISKDSPSAIMVYIICFIIFTLLYYINRVIFKKRKASHKKINNSTLPLLVDSKNK